MNYLIFDIPWENINKHPDNDPRDPNMDDPLFQDHEMLPFGEDHEMLPFGEDHEMPPFGDKLWLVKGEE